MKVFTMRGRLARRTGAVLLVLGLGLVGATGAAGAAARKGPDLAAAPLAAVVPNVVGTWELTTDWGCDGSITGSFTQTFNADGTWTSTPFVHSGRYYQVGGIVVWTFADTANLVYSGNLSGSWINGAQGYETAGGGNGCFGGHRAGVPGLAGAPAAADRKSDPAVRG
ncbi:hypothetical protein WEI85_14255 [Actinomycetes bacterium KLBMP 9797]